MRIVHDLLDALPQIGRLRGRNGLSTASGRRTRRGLGGPPPHGIVPAGVSRQYPSERTPLRAGIDRRVQDQGVFEERKHSAIDEGCVFGAQACGATQVSPTWRASERPRRRSAYLREVPNPAACKLAS